jgi:hypothetical protein
MSKEYWHAHERYTSTFIIPCSIFDIHEGRVGAAHPAGCYPNAPVFEPGPFFAVLSARLGNFLAKCLIKAGGLIWYIDLAALGIDLGNVTEISIGLERTGAAGGTGTVFIDEILLYRI